MKAPRTLIFFTLQYPYGKKSETFIENEIQYLANAFERVIIIPREKKEHTKRELPQNVEVNDMLITSKPVGNRFKFILSSIKRLLAVCSIYGYTVLKDKYRKHYLTGGYFIYYLANALKDAELIHNYIENSQLKQAVIYDYWFVNSTLSLAYLKSKGTIKNVYCRAHGFDVFNERWACGTVPFREYILKHADAVYAISDYNKRYIQKQLNDHKAKVKVAYLGVRHPQGLLVSKNEIEATTEFLIVSCANLAEFKQIHRIPEVLKHVELGKRSIKWVHFGDGPYETEVLNAAKQLPKGIDFEYKGHVANQNVLDFYAENNVNLFLSLSLKEGLPVSMMEAQSFGVPIMAYDIFGIPEIVSQETGVLLQTKNSNAEISQKLTQLLQTHPFFDKDQIERAFNERFNAKSNYSAFVKQLVEKNGYDT